MNKGSSYAVGKRLSKWGSHPLTAEKSITCWQDTSLQLWIWCTPSPVQTTKWTPTKLVKWSGDKKPEIFRTSSETLRWTDQKRKVQATVNHMPNSPHTVWNPASCTSAFKNIYISQNHDTDKRVRYTSVHVDFTHRVINYSIAGIPLMIWGSGVLSEQEITKPE